MKNDDNALQVQAVNHGEEGAEPEDKTFDLLIHLCTNPHLWSRYLTERMRLRIQAAEMGFL